MRIGGKPPPGGHSVSHRPSAAWSASLGLVLVSVASWAAPPKRIAILPIVVHTHESQEYLQSGLADMLASRLGRAAGVAVIRVSEPELATTDLAAAQAAARAVGAEYVLFGSFTRFGQGASLDVRCAGVGDSSDDAPRSIFIQSGTLGEIIPRLDGLADKIGRYVVAGGLAPDVAAAGPSVSRSEIEVLRGRVEALESRVFRPEGDVEEIDLGSRGPDPLESDPDLHSDLR